MYGRSFNFILLAALTIAGVAPQQSVAQEVIRIGAPLPLTGPLSPEGIKQKQGYDLWAEVANSKGGVKAGGKSYKIEIVYVDYASNTPRAVQTAERLITEDKVNFLFSPFGSGAKPRSGVPSALIRARNLRKTRGEPFCARAVK